jgi:hypothetical protein
MIWVTIQTNRVGIIPPGLLPGKDRFVDGSPSLTKQLQSYSGGDREIAETVLREVLPRLHQIAVRELRRERYVTPLSPTELINEVWLRNLRKGGWQINSREHSAGCERACAGNAGDAGSDGDDRKWLRQGNSNDQQCE